MSKNKKLAYGIRGFLLVCLLTGGWFLLKNDGIPFLLWWLTITVLGVLVYPVTGSLFAKFHDRGWLVSKVLGIAFSGFFMWLFSNLRWMEFTRKNCIMITICMGAVVWVIYYSLCCKGKNHWSVLRFPVEILESEICFVVFFLFWTYAAGFRPQAYGTEKFMDYGFMAAMMRSTKLPAEDLWYAGESINYYYGGQYFAVYLTKLTGTQIKETYNLMRTMVAGMAFALPFSLVRQMLMDRGKVNRSAAAIGGILAGAGVSLAGNMHYVVIGKILPWIRKIFHLPAGEYTYWFPNSTRYIGYYPAENDKTIHEFPSYSFILGDLHAHVVNVFFVLTVVCLIYALIQKSREEDSQWNLRSLLLQPHILVFGFFIGLFHWTNFWDFVIYYVMGGMGVIYANYLRYREGKKVVIASCVHAVWVYVLGTVFALPFTMQFESMVSGIALAQNHSRPYQWWLIWGLQVAVTLLFFLLVFLENRRDKHPFQIAKADMFAVILGISALGLILIPEIVYVRDIYEKEFARSNTMFKLTYQAFMMFGMVMAYTFVRMWKSKGYLGMRILSAIFVVCFLGCVCYVGTGVNSWFGNLADRNLYQGLDATAFLEEDFSEDAAAIRWLDENIAGTEVVLEANGDSYSDYERVSAMTGLPTVLGWYVHEWLWRSGIENLNQRSADVETIYTSSDEQNVKALLRKYDISYIFVGAQEREKYENLNDTMLARLGDPVFEDVDSGTYIIKIIK